MSKPDDTRDLPTHAAPVDLADRSEVDLILALAETGDLVDAYVTLHEQGVDTAGELADACADLADIQDELMRRGFSYRTFCS